MSKHGQPLAWIFAAWEVWSRCRPSTVAGKRTYRHMLDLFQNMCVHRKPAQIPVMAAGHAGIARKRLSLRELLLTVSNFLRRTRLTFSGVSPFELVFNYRGIILSEAKDLLSPFVQESRAGPSLRSG